MGAICLSSAALAALMAACAEGAHLWLRTSLADDPPRLLLATLLGAAVLVPPALFLGLLQAATIGAYPEGFGVRGRLNQARGWFSGARDQASEAGRDLARPVAVTGTLMGLTYLGLRVGPESLAGMMPPSWELTPNRALVLTLTVAAVVLYLSTRWIARRILVLAATPGKSRITARRVLQAAAFTLAGVAAGAVVIGGETIEGFGGREPALGLAFVAAQAAFAVALATPAVGRRRLWVLNRLQVVGLIGLLPATHLLFFGLDRHASVRDALINETHLVRRLVGVYHVMLDLDGDGFSSLVGGGDCDDDDVNIHPHARDIPGDGIDQNCDGIDPDPPPPPPPPKPPKPAGPAHPSFNVVAITVDTLRADRLSAYGYGRKTSPRIDQMAAEGIRFERFWSQGANTKYATTSMFTVRYFSEMRRCPDLWVHVHPDEVTFTELLQNAGVHTGGVSSHRFFQTFSGHMDGFDDLDIGIVKKHGRNVNWRPVGSETTPHALAMLDKLEAKVADEGGRFFLWIHYYDPHSAFVRHRGQPNWGSEPSDLYDGEIRFLDRMLRPLLDRLATSPRGDDTVVMLHSDHGEGLGDHGYQYHGKTLYEDQLRVPFILQVPGASPRVVRTPSSNIDIGRTVLEFMHVEPLERYRGQSLVPWIFGEEPDDLERPVYAEMAEDPKHKPKRTWVHWPWKLILNVKTGATKLFDLERDRKERRNLARKEPATNARMLAELQQYFDQVVEWTAPATWPGHSDLKRLR